MVDELWDVYAGALIECTVGGVVRSLRGPEAEPLPADAPLFVMTAFNPQGVERDEATNDADEAALEHDLAAAGLAYWQAKGRSPDDSWSEPGVAVAGLDRGQACEYGERYGQLAIYELTDDEVHVVRCFDAEIIRSAARKK